MIHRWLRVACASAALALAVTAVAGGDVKASNKWRIEVSEGAHNAGTIAIRVTPHEGTASDVNVSIAKGRSENEIARDIRDALKAQLPVDRFHVEVDDGEDVLVKKASGQPDFVLVLVSSDLKGTRLHVQRE